VVLPSPRIPSEVILYGLADYRLNDFGEIIEFYVSRDEADTALQGRADGRADVG
jgi:hypothetical protein